MTQDPDDNDNDDGEWHRMVHKLSLMSNLHKQIKPETGQSYVHTEVTQQISRSRFAFKCSINYYNV